MTQTINLEPRFSPFSNGSQFVDWESSNCGDCKLYNPDEYSVTTCQIHEALADAAIDDGKVSQGIAKRMGYLGEDGSENGNYIWFCTERNTGLGTPAQEATAWQVVRDRQIAAQQQYYKQQEDDRKEQAAMHELIYQIVTPQRLSNWQPKDKYDAWERYGEFTSAVERWVASHDGYPFVEGQEENVANHAVYHLLYSIADRSAKEERKRVLGKLRAMRTRKAVTA